MRAVLFIFLFIFLCLISFSNIIRRYHWDKSFKNTFFVVDIDLFIDDLNLKTDNIFNSLKNAGISAVALSYEYFSKIEKQKESTNFIVKLNNSKKNNFDELDNFVKINKNRIISLILVPQNYKYSYQILSKPGFRYNLDNILRIIKKYNLFAINFEFSDWTLGSICRDKLNSFRCFLLDMNTQVNFILKIKKAIFERSCNIIFLIPSESSSFEDNLIEIKNIVSRYRSSLNEHPLYSRDYFSTISSKYLSFAVIVFGFLVFPVYLYRYVFNLNLSKNVQMNYFFINFSTLFIGVICYGLLQNYDYIVLNKSIPGIKIIFLLPVFTINIFIFSKNELVRALDMNIKTKHLFLAFLIIFMFGYMVLRMDNVKEKYVFRFEIIFRQLIENYILYRPRFKELFIGHPLLYFSLYFLRHDKKIPLYKFLFALSIIGQVSMLNTFLHLNTPLYYSFLRSLLGIFLGVLFGKIFVLAYKNIRERLTET